MKLKELEKEIKARRRSAVTEYDKLFILALESVIMYAKLKGTAGFMDGLALGLRVIK